MGSLRDLIVYKKGFALAMNIFDITKSLPGDEKFSLTSQIRRSSRAVCANLAEAYRKRQYPSHFISKISDVDTKNTETAVWIDFMLACNYINVDSHKNLNSTTLEIGRLLSDMINSPEKYCIKKTGNNNFT
jgi:four helix bundle protein